MFAEKEEGKKKEKERESETERKINRVCVRLRKKKIKCSV